jgi:mono/diheme cytochrome c family protein
MDRVDGAWLGQLGPRDAAAPRIAVLELLRRLDAEDPGAPVKLAVLDTAVALNMAITSGFALRWLEQDAGADVRIAALEALAALESVRDEAMATAIRLALSDDDAAVRTAAISRLPEMPAAAAVSVGELVQLLDAEGLSDAEKQSAIAALGVIDAASARDALAALITRLEAGALPATLEFDVLEAARAGGNDRLLARLDATGVGRQLENLASARPTALQFGGDARRGRQLALQHPAAQCVRCHAIGDGESTVGPPLNGIGMRLSRAELLESLVDPGASIAAGFGEAAGVSAMPPMGMLLTPQEMRDLVEFMATER